VLFRKFPDDTAEKSQIIPYPGSQDSCGKEASHHPEAYPASGKIRKSTALTALPGSLTLEAALVLPIVIMLLTAVMTLTSMMMTEVRIQKAMEDTAASAAGAAYAVTGLTEGEKGTLIGTAGGSIALMTVSEQTVKNRVKEAAGENFAEASGIEGGWDGISFLGTRYDSDSGDMTILAAYSLKVPFFYSFGAKIRLSQKVVHRAWIGKPSAGEGAEEIVYITQSGTVYHTSLACSHLKLSVSSVRKTAVSARRNADGSKYRPCEVCGEEEADTVYITNYGDRYHTNRNCPGLKRTIMSLPLSQVGGRPLCKTCKKRSGQ